MVDRDRSGSYETCTVAGETYKAYIPEPLPPAPPLQMEELYPLLEQANIAIGRLDGISINVPDPSLFIYMYIRKEAVLSSQIEGTQSTLSDLLMYENEGIVGALEQDIIEVSNYVAAMEHGRKRIQEGFPLCLRLIREMHEILLSKGRGSAKQPGEFRRSQNWLGGTRPGNAKYVPPPPEKVVDLLSALEKFLHDETSKIPVLIMAALAHVQFESIHPFLDGNGRIGRLLITFILCVNNVMRQPLLYLSVYFKYYRSDYYDYLQRVRDAGDWEGWLKFFLRGVIETATEAVEIVEKISRLFDNDKQKIEAAGKTSAMTFTVYNYLQKTPIVDSKKIMQACTISLPTTNKILHHLINIGIVSEITGKARNKIYIYQRYLDVLSAGDEPSILSVDDKENNYEIITKFVLKGLEFQIKYIKKAGAVCDRNIVARASRKALEKFLSKHKIDIHNVISESIRSKFTAEHPFYSARIMSLETKDGKTMQDEDDDIVAEDVAEL